MARYVLLTFEDNEEADNFVKAIQDGNERGRSVVAYETRHPKLEGKYGTSRIHDDLTVEAMYAKPTRFCNCTTPPPHTSATGARYGWRVHISCGLPKEGWVHHPTNLLDPNPPKYPGASGLYLGTREPRKKE